MSSIFKNQILKPLSRFTKNLNPEQLNISALKGEGELTNLELDEFALMDLLDLPTWLLLKKAVCNKVSVKIQWTKLKTNPILVNLDEVTVEIEALKEPRPLNSGDSPIYRANPGKYGMIDRVMDGIKVSVNRVNINFQADAFRASVELTRLLVSSKTPNWRTADHLKLTSIRDPGRNVILLFKEIEWETTRFEASGLESVQVTPVRLITNSTSIRMTLKKRLSDCTILGSRVEFLMDELLWILTVSQVEAAIIFFKSLTKSILKSAEQSKTMAEEKLKRQMSTPLNYVDSTDGSLSATTNNNAKISHLKRIFSCYDVSETSYHLFCKRIELHFCEEGDQKSKLSRNALASGSLQLCLSKIKLDFYPFHPHKLDRSWRGYSEQSTNRSQWVNRLFEHYRKQGLYQPPTNDENQPETPGKQPASVKHLMETVVLLKLTDIQMKNVTTPKKAQSQLFIGSDKDLYKLPIETVTLSVDYTSYYYSDHSTKYLPPPNLFCHVNPLHVRIDYETVIWLHAFFLNLATNLKRAIREYVKVGLAGLLMTPEELFAPLTLNTRIEALMPRLVFPAELDIACGQPERPTSLQVQASTLILANHLPNGLGPGTQLQELILNYKEGHNHDCNKEFFKSSIMHSFPKKSSDLQIRWNVFQNRDPVQPPEAQLHVHNDPLYYFHCDQLWLEFSGAKTAGNKPQPFLDPIPLTLFTHLTYHTSNIREINLLIDCPSSAVNVHLSHYQFLFIARLSESLQRVADALSEDYNEIFDTGNHNFKDCTSSEAHFFNLMKSSVKTSLQTGIRLKCLSITLVMPALCEPIPKMDSINSIFNDRSWSDIPQHCPPSDFAEEQNFEVCRPPEPDTSDKPLRSKPQFLQNFIQKVDPDPEVIKSNSLSNSHSERQSFPYSSSKSKVKRIDESKRSTSHSNYQQKSFNPASLPFKVGQFGSLDKKVTSFGMSVRGFGEKMLATMQSHDEVASSHTDSVVSPTDSDLSDSEDEAIVLLLQDSLIEHQQLNLPGVSLVSRSSELRNYLANNTQMKSDERDEAFSVTSSGTSRNRDVFSTITFHLTGVDTSIGYADHAASVAFSLNDCRISESGREQSVMSSSQQSGSPYLGTSISVPMENTDSKFLKPLLLCRIETAPPNDQDKADDDSKSNISIETRLLRPLDLSFLMSSLTNMIDFFEEEILPKSGPSGSSSLSVLLDILGGNVTLKLDEDRPCANLTCPGQHSQLKMEIPQGLRVIRSIDGLIKVDLNLIPPKTTAKIDQKVPTIRDSRSNSPLTVVSSPQRPIMINCAVQTHSNSPPLNASNSVPENASDTLLAPVSKSPSISSSLTASTQTEESALTSPQVPASPAGGGHTPSQEILTRYYSENVKLRDKVSGLQKDKRSLNDELFSCQQALEELKRERDALQARLKSQGGTSPYLSSEKQRSPLPEISYIQSSSPTDNNPTLDKQRTPGSSPFRVPIASLDSKSTCNRESFVPINADYTQEHYPKSFPESSGTSYYQRDSSGTRVRLSPDITASLDQRSLLPNTDYLSFRIRSPSTGRLSTSKEFVAPTVSNFQPFSSENPDPKTSPSQRRATSKN